MSDARRRTLEEQAEEFAGRRAAVCRCLNCGTIFISEKLSSKWCCAGCRKAAFMKRRALPPLPHGAHHRTRGRSVVEEVFASAAASTIASALEDSVEILSRAKTPARCVHCGGKVRNRIESAICGMCGLNFDGA